MTPSWNSNLIGHHRPLSRGHSTLRREPTKSPKCFVPSCYFTQCMLHVGVPFTLYLFLKKRTLRASQATAPLLFTRCPQYICFTFCIPFFSHRPLQFFKAVGLPDIIPNTRILLKIKSHSLANKLCRSVMQIRVCYSTGVAHKHAKGTSMAK